MGTPRSKTAGSTSWMHQYEVSPKGGGSKYEVRRCRRRTMVLFGVRDHHTRVSIAETPTTREDDALGLEREICQLCGTWQHLSVDLEASQPAEDQMARLAAKIQNEDGLYFTRSATFVSPWALILGLGGETDG